jgi:hypothetical protein
MSVSDARKESNGYFNCGVEGRPRGSRYDPGIITPPLSWRVRMFATETRRLSLRTQSNHLPSLAQRDPR